MRPRNGLRSHTIAIDRRPPRGPRNGLRSYTIAINDTIAIDRRPLCAAGTVQNHAIL